MASNTWAVGFLGLKDKNSFVAFFGFVTSYRDGGGGRCVVHCFDFDKLLSGSIAEQIVDKEVGTIGSGGLASKREEVLSFQILVCRIVEVRNF